MSVRQSHYSDIIMSAMASQITGVLIVYSTVSGAKKRTPKFRATGLSPVTNSPQRSINAENVSIWWRHHVNVCGTNRNIFTFSAVTELI